MLKSGKIQIELSLSPQRSFRVSTRSSDRIGSSSGGSVSSRHGGSFFHRRLTSKPSPARSMSSSTSTSSSGSARNRTAAATVTISSTPEQPLIENTTSSIKIPQNSHCARVAGSPRSNNDSPFEMVGSDQSGSGTQSSADSSVVSLVLAGKSELV